MSNVKETLKKAKNTVVKKLKNFENKYIEVSNKFISKSEKLLPYCLTAVIAFIAIDAVALNLGGYKYSYTPMENALRMTTNSIDILFGSNLEEKVSRKLETKNENVSYVENKFPFYIEGISDKTSNITSEEITSEEKVNEESNSISETNSNVYETESIVETKISTKSTTTTFSNPVQTKIVSNNVTTNKTDEKKIYPKKSSKKTVWIGRPHFPKKEAYVDDCPVVAEKFTEDDEYIYVEYDDPTEVATVGETEETSVVDETIANETTPDETYKVQEETTTVIVETPNFAPPVSEECE